MKSIITGGCACGSIRYAANVAAEFSIICQCRQCQRCTGSGHAASFAVAVESTTLEGDIQYYKRTSDDGNTVSSGFCGICGNPILNKTTLASEYLMFHAATLDDPSSFKPQTVVYSEFKQAWDYVDPTLPRS